MKGPRPFRRNHPKRITWAERAEAERRREEDLQKGLMFFRSLISDALTPPLDWLAKFLRRIAS